MLGMSRALISVSDKSGLVEFARALSGLGVELVSTGGTARALSEAGLAVTGIAEVTGFPEMLDGRVKTLHPRVHGGILARRHRPDDMAAIAAHDITPIDLVVVNLYPFAAAAANPATTVDDLIEEIDIGGPSLVRAAAKNFRDVLVVVDPGDYAAVVEALGSAGGPSVAFRFELARKAFAHTGAYDAMIATTLGGLRVHDEAVARPEPGEIVVPSAFGLVAPRRSELRYGENPHQKAAWYAWTGMGGLGEAEVLQGKALSFTNLLDLDAAARIVLEFPEPAASVIKHTNPCGVATGTTPAEAYLRAREADPLSAFGGIVGLNRPIDEETARAITSTFIEAVVAPGVDDAARAVLGAKTNLRVVVMDLAALASRAGDLEVRSVLGSLLVQARDRVVEALDPWPSDAVRVVTERQPTADEWQALRFAWRVGAHVKSNTVIFTSADRTLAIGAGQMSRVDAVKVAVMKAQGSLAGSVAASDAFFPFRDGLDEVARAGARAVVQPGGSVRDAEVIAAANEHGLAMVFTGRRHFRH
ncbi:MAG: bifunctional phosphoribosylaminoimidazolecarboxamide formyltransferase/IMP cyclohydrolase [Vicinamibacteraceae bacterium]|nr:bifunctional phosphoribosylaminoimidazolecarboxamide formyltransferase/IMP cyclohydrolase [Vicinamibacteraceae bacterium]